MRLVLPVASLALVACATIPSEPTSPAIEIEDAAGLLDARTSRDLSQEAAASADVITKLVGGSAARLIRLVIDPSRRVPFTEDPGPGGEVVIRIPAARIKSGDIAGSAIALAHEITHAVAPGGRPDGRFLVEGFAVYMDDRLGGTNYPDFDQSPHQTVRRLEAQVGQHIPLRDSEAARLEHPDGDSRQLAYAQEGSFVGWLIETRGLRGFLAFYNSRDSYEEGLGKSLPDLERDWRQWLAAR